MSTFVPLSTAKFASQYPMKSDDPVRVYITPRLTSPFKYLKILLGAVQCSRASLIEK